ncbi:hypothetical protein F5148DRAFT_1276283 [Russula earlei]|uniref:Uncharacterized protein n=1 Tax=Russula earlei TaxID=71964 RepID=A0ACC0U8S3_9AGAM|nr:hypothetical protein F5148DRAFT_1276283 [Russula earlei]
MTPTVFNNPSATPTSDLTPGPTSSTETTSALQETTEERESNEAVLGDGKKCLQKAARRRKVNQACLYCRRSHMTCDEGRPCQRCVKREIGHLCHDENKQVRQSAAQSQTTVAAPAPQMSTPGMCRFSVPPLSSHTLPPSVPPGDGLPCGDHLSTAPAVTPSPSPTWPILPASQSTYLYPHETFGREFSSLSDFLETLDEQAFFTGSTVHGTDTFGSAALDVSGATPPPAPGSSGSNTPDASTVPGQQAQPQVNDLLQRYVDLVPPVLPSASLTEKFLLTAADPSSGTRDERLKRVIRTKYEAGLLKPYNYVKGYSRLSRWMDCNVSQESKQQILQPLSVLRPKFRAIAQSLRDIDLVFIEEAFERLMLDYDRVFACMGIPACLWRRTGEIYKGNREFAELVGLDGHMLRDGRLCIYELMAEESAVNYWEKYGNVAFDSTQKAVLTSCVFRYKPALDQGSGSARTTATEEGFISCCFSFTIRRDTWGIPLMIVGNFIRC